MEWIRLIGIAIIVVGFILKFDTIATVVLAGLVTALVSGVSLVEFWRFWEKNLAISECSRFLWLPCLLWGCQKPLDSSNDQSI